MAGKGSTLRIDIIADASRASSTMDAVGGKAGAFGKKLAAGAALGAAGVVAAAGSLALSSIKSASAVEQAYGATESVFGKFAGQVKASAKDAATSVGLAQSEYAGLANVLGAQLKNMGTSADKLAPKTDQLIKQGADLAATFGGTTADAVSAVSSLLKGERDPIERYGVSIKAADVAARLQAQGLDGLKGPALAAAQAQATLALLTEQTSSAQGAFSRESGTAAGQQQRLTAQWENAKSSLGAGLLPMVTKVATFLTTSVMPAVQGAAATLAKNLGPALSTVSAFIQQRVIPAAREFLAWFKDKIVPGIRSYVTPIINGLRGAFASVQAAVERNRPQLETIGRVLKGLAEFIAAKVAPVVGGVLGAAFKVAGKIIGLVIDQIGRIVSVIQAAIGWIQRLKDAASNLSVGGILGGLNPFGLMSSSSLTVNQAPTASPTSLTLAAGLTAPAQTLTSSPGSLSGKPIDLGTIKAQNIVNNYLTVRVDGALDPVAVADQIADLLRAQARRTGRPVVMVAP